MRSDEPAVVPLETVAAGSNETRSPAPAGETSLPAATTLYHAVLKLEPICERVHCWVVA